jgi:hypothetical protein
MLINCCGCSHNETLDEKYNVCRQSIRTRELNVIMSFRRFWLNDDKKKILNYVDVIIHLQPKNCLLTRYEHTLLGIGLTPNSIQR